jgi:EAL domain-containing protein (putative c-di-GMP-specific phosphodiesterase class I)
MVHKELASDPNVSLGLNVSPQTVLSRKWLDHARILLKDPSITSRLIIEITETGMHKNLNKVIEFVDTVQSLGCQIAIDDFGAGYTSFTQLKLLNADIIKIDGVFIRDIVDNHDSRLFVKTLIDFAKAFCLQTVAEFVETGDIAKTLIDLGVDYLQGYYFGKALNHRPWVTDDKASNI